MVQTSHRVVSKYLEGLFTGRCLSKRRLGGGKQMGFLVVLEVHPLLADLGE